MGITDKFQVQTDWERIGEFCFTIPPGTHGLISTDIGVEADGHRLILVKDDEMFDILASKDLQTFQPFKRPPLHYSFLRRLAVPANETSSPAMNQMTPAPKTSTTESSISAHSHSEEAVVAPGVPRLESVSVQPPQQQQPSTADGERASDVPNSPPAPLSAATDVVQIVDNPPAALPEGVTTVCDALVAKARVRENLELPTHGKRASASYKLSLWVEAHVNMHRVSIVVTRCGAIPNAHFVIQLKNPGGIFKAHFSCQDQGLLEIYLVITFACALLALPLHRAWKELSLTSHEHPVVAVLFLGIFAFFLATGLTFLHFFVYALDGLGLAVFAFVAALANLAYTVAMVFVASYFLFPLGKDQWFPETEEIVTKEVVPSRFTTSQNPLFAATATRTTVSSPACINLNAVPAFLHRVAHPVVLLGSIAASAFLYTLLASLRLPAPGEPLSPVEKLLQWRRPHGVASWTDGVLVVVTVAYLVSRSLAAAVIFQRHLLKRDQRKPSVATQDRFPLCCVVWLCLPPLLAFACVSWSGPFRHVPLFLIQVTNLAIIYVAVQHMKHIRASLLAAGAGRDPVGAERQHLVGFPISSSALVQAKTTHTSYTDPVSDLDHHPPPLLDLANAR